MRRPGPSDVHDTGAQRLHRQGHLPPGALLLRRRLGRRRLLHPRLHHRLRRRAPPPCSTALQRTRYRRSTCMRTPAPVPAASRLRSAAVACQWSSESVHRYHAAWPCTAGGGRTTELRSTGYRLETSSSCRAVESRSARVPGGAIRGEWLGLVLLQLEL